METERNGANRAVPSEWNRTQAEVAVLRIDEIIAQRAASKPTGAAVICGAAKLTYTQLDTHANALAVRLRGLGLGPGQFAAVLLPRAIDLPVALLAVLKTGAAYLPVDPEYPLQRIALVLADAAVPIVVTCRALADRIPESMTTLLIDDDAGAIQTLPAVAPAVAVDGEDPIYVIYTSGSTGTPKGAVLPHRGPLNQYDHYIRALDIVPESRFLVFSSIGFDLTQRNIWAPLMAGGCVVLLESPVYDVQAILSTIEREGITHLCCTPSAFYGLIEQDASFAFERLNRLQQLALGGESLQMAHLAAWRSSPGFRTRITNCYGPTEASANVAMFHLAADEPSVSGALPIGKPIANTRLYLLDAQLQQVDEGAVGELCIAGRGVALGYLNRPEQTAAVFVNDLSGSGLMYRTGDQARLRPDGNLEFLGRIDQQVKVRGVRIELGEIEAVLTKHPDVRAVAAAVNRDRLYACVNLRAGVALDAQALRTHCASMLPDAIVPSAFVALDELPLNAHGKLDRARLPAPSRERPPLTSAYSQPRGTLEKTLATLWQDVLGLDDIGRNDRFFELGGTSLNAVQVLGRLSRVLDLSLPAVDFFGAPTLSSYARHLVSHSRERIEAVLGKDALVDIDTEIASLSKPRGRRATTSDEDIAIVGFSARLPGAENVDIFWQNLINGIESIRTLTDIELDKAGVDASVRRDPDFVRAAATLDHADCFDAAFFGYSPREAELMDPQQRVLLECAWAALEHAGIDPSTAEHEGAKVGVYAGVARNSYFQFNLAGNSRVRPQLAEVQITYGNDKDYAATRVSYKLGLTGPAFTTQTACSTGGVLMHQARRALQAGECDVAIVGGARVVCPLDAGYLSVEGSIMSRDGRMRVFDAQGSGMIRASGVACLVLKRRADAEREGDTIYALINGSALNNDGASKAAYSAPSAAGQTEVIELAMADARVAAEDISYIEAHGTATHLGDPIEIAGLTQAFRNMQRGDSAVAAGTCTIGSVKSNVGHLDPAAGVVSALKVALMLHHRRVPPSLGFETPNPQIDFAHSPFRVADRLTEWDAPFPRRAGVSSFGIGGTNAHLILQEASRPAIPSVAAARGWQVLPLSAKTDAALSDAVLRLGGWCSSNMPSLSDAAWTLQTGRARFEKRVFVIARDTSEAAQCFAATDRVVRGSAIADASLVFVFPGQGAQHPGMGRGLYETEPVFRAIVDEGCALLQSELNVDLRTVLYPDAATAASAAETLRQTSLAQPAIFLVSYAYAKLLESRGLRPAAMLGHSVGEFTAATLAGVFSFADALHLLAARARLMQSMPGGAMLAVRRPEGEVAALLPSSIAIAAVNAPQITIVSGPIPDIDQLNADLKSRDVPAMRLHTSHAFHSQMMEPIVVAFSAEVAKVPRGAPQIPIISTLTGRTLTVEEAHDPQHWARQLRERVAFAPAIAQLLHVPGRVLLEIGPGQSLSGPLRQIVAATVGSNAVVVAAASPADGDDKSAEHLAGAIGRLWLAGIEPNWRALHESLPRHIGLPTYAFARTRHWVQPDTNELAAPADSITLAAETKAESHSGSEAPVAQPASDPIRERTLSVLVDITGLSFAPADEKRSFLELGMDSLVLTQVAGKLKNTFSVDLRFRQLLEELSTPEKLLNWLRERSSVVPSSANDAADLGDAGAQTPDADSPAPASGSTFGAGARISTRRDPLSTDQRTALDALIARYTSRTAKSKAQIQQHRAHFADPRSVSGFKPAWKEAIYPIVSLRSDGAYLWDIDGNRYIDTINGFGATLFGHKPKFVDAALHAQIEKGYEIGPMPDFCGEVAERFARMVKLERVAFCNTGSEAVSAAQRCARTVTGRDLIASFAHDYHGVHDEVIVRAGPKGRGLPAASGIPASHTANALVLDYGSDTALETLRARADELAAIMVEPIQSRHQDLQPREFLHACRDIATRAGCAFIMDEVITGFRLAPGGAQEHFGVTADLASYGKVFGGGMPVGAIAGSAKFMDALDGGFWRFGDESFPEAGVTYFAGTFVRHPLAMAAALATLKHMEANPGIQYEMNARIARFVARLRDAFERLAAPIRITHYTSIFRFVFTQDEPFGELLAHYFRERGVHTYDGRNQVMTTEHTEAVLDEMLQAYVGGVEAMQRDGLLGRVGYPVKLGGLTAAETFLRAGDIFASPPRSEARLGRDADGNPGWFVPNPDRSGRFLQVTHVT